MRNNNDTFIFKPYEVNTQSGTFIFHYEVIHNAVSHSFTESIHVNTPLASEGSRTSIEGIKNILDTLRLALGISYWKLYCPERIELEGGALSENQAEFWNTFYTKGLGEFFYRNNIDFRNLIHFPYSPVNHPESGIIALRDEALLLFGGGKDSILSGELLKKHGKNFQLFSVGTYGIHRDTAALMHEPLLTVSRKIDPLLIELNKQKEAYNGHIPMTAIYSLVGLLVALLTGYKYVIESSEESSNYGNVQYLGTEINHQWSKSFEFEELLQTYIRKYIHNELTYFSLLRPIKEIRIVKLFSGYPQYFQSFSSCNTNFRLDGETGNGRWCGKCAKCVFVFLLLASFIRRTEAERIFGAHIFKDETLESIYLELLGLSGFKPFECVGTPEEARWALFEILKGGEYKDSKLLYSLSTALTKNSLAQPESHMVFSLTRQHHIPKLYTEVMSSL